MTEAEKPVEIISAQLVSISLPRYGTLSFRPVISESPSPLLTNNITTGLCFVHNCA